MIKMYLIRLVGIYISFNMHCEYFYYIFKLQQNGRLRKLQFLFPTHKSKSIPEMRQKYFIIKGHPR